MRCLRHLVCYLIMRVRVEWRVSHTVSHMHIQFGVHTRHVVRVCALLRGGFCPFASPFYALSARRSVCYVPTVLLLCVSVIDLQQLPARTRAIQGGRADTSAFFVACSTAAAAASSSQQLQHSHFVQGGGLGAVLVPAVFSLHLCRLARAGGGPIWLLRLARAYVCCHRQHCVCMCLCACAWGSLR